MDPATKLILEEIGRLGVKLVSKERTEIIITPDNLKRFWTKVGGVHVIINVRGTLWALQSCNEMQCQH
jgi:hypothetical protein